MTQPAFMWKTERLVESMAFFDRSNKKDPVEDIEIQIVYITKNNDICILKKPAPSTTITRPSSIIPTSPESVFLQVYGKELGKKTNEQQSQHNIHNPKEIDISTILIENMPSHAIPPASNLYSSYMNLLLFKSIKKKVGETEIVAKIEDGVIENEKRTIPLQKTIEPTLKEITNVINQEMEDSAHMPIRQFYSDMFEFFTNSDPNAHSLSLSKTNISKKSPTGKTKSTKQTSSPNKFKHSTSSTLETTSPRKRKTKPVQNGTQDTSNGNSSPPSELKRQTSHIKRKRSPIHTINENGTDEVDG